MSGLLARASAGRDPGHGFVRASARPGARSSFKLRGVEGWRGVACLVVVAYHVWQNMDADQDGAGPAGSTAMLAAILSLDVVVDLFFVLSALLLFLPFAHAALDDGRRIPLAKEFLWRRCVRLFPVYWVLVVLCWSTRNFGFETAQWKDLLLHLTMLQAFDSETIFHTIGPAWTLSIEWIFYLLLAALAPSFVVWVRAGGVRRRRMVRLLAPLGVVTLASVLYKINVQLVWDIPATDWAWRFGPAAKADEFALGMALAVVMVALGERRLPAVASLAAGVAGLWLIYEGRVRLDVDADSMISILRHPVASVGWCLVLFAVMSCRSERPARWVDNALFVRLSIVAYVVYLVHEPVILLIEDLGLLSFDPGDYLVNLALAMALTLVSAWLLHRTVEEPWVDLAALQAKGGGRRDLYGHLDHTVATSQLTTGRPVWLRDEVTAESGSGPDVVRTGAR